MLCRSYSNNTLKKLTISTLALVFIGASGTVLAESLNLPQLEELIKQGKNQQAYEQASQFLNDYEGDPQFDYLYGVAAIDSGHISQGLFALERVVLLNPTDNRARLELARGYFLLEEDDRARSEFTTVLASNPPAAVVANIEKFIAIMDVRAASSKSVASAYVELAIGHDTNINSAPGDANFFSPLLGGINITLGNQSLEDSAEFFNISAGGKLSHPFGKGKQLTLGIDASSRQHSNDETFETETINAYANISIRQGRDRWRVGGLVQEFEVGEIDNRSLFSLNGEWARQLDPNTLWSNGAQVAQIRFPGQAIRNSTLLTLSSALTHRYQMKWQPVVSVAGFVGAEIAEGNSVAARSTAERSLFGARIAGQITPAPKWTLSASVLAQNSHYEGENAIVGVTRNENFYQAGVNAQWSIDKNWSAGAGVNYTRNDSNSTINDYDRTQTQVSLRYAF